MKHRLTRITTKRGDKGRTRLADGTLVDKDHPRIHACGALDELNSLVGVVVSADAPAPLSELLLDIQHDLFDLGGELCMPGHEILTAAHVERLEQALDALNKRLQPLEEFVLPGGTPAAASCHVARTVCRRMERDLVHLAREEKVSAEAIKYVNRLSDLLFVVARTLNREAGIPDVLWKRARGMPGKGN